MATAHGVMHRPLSFTNRRLYLNVIGATSPNGRIRALSLCASEVFAVAFRHTDCCTVTDICPCCPSLRREDGLTITSTSCPRIVRNSIKRPTDTDTGRQRIIAETCGCVVPSSFAASISGGVGPSQYPEIFDIH